MGDSFKILFIFGCIGSLLLHASFLQLQPAGATLHFDVQASHCSGFSLQSTSSRVQAQQLQRMGLVLLWHMGSSWIRDRRIKSMFSALAGGFLTTGPPGKFCMNLKCIMLSARCQTQKAPPCIFYLRNILEIFKKQEQKTLTLNQGPVFKYHIERQKFPMTNILTHCFPGMKEPRKVKYHWEGFCYCCC